ncbi:MAG: hypothetical protein RSF00_08865 [Oscillospiraceae bacterium]
MISLTKFLKIKKDDDNEFYDVNLKNSNMDIIDAAAEKDSAAIAALQSTKADKTAVSEELSHKANVEPTTIDDTLDLFTLKNGEYTFEGNVPALKNYPPIIVGGYQRLHIRVYGRVSLAAVGYGFITVVSSYGANYKTELSYSAWTPWVQLATATPPQEFDLPVVGGHLFYSKNQLEFVTIDIQINSATIIQPGQIGTVPIGYAPKRNIKFAVPSDDGTTFRISDVVVFTDGTIYSGVAIKNCVAQISFQKFS